MQTKLAIAGSVLALIAGVFLVITRYHESRKAAAEADRAARETSPTDSPPQPPSVSAPSGQGAEPKTKQPASAPRFAEFEGKWAVKYANGYTHEYIINSKGEIYFERCISPNGTVFVKDDERRGHLDRHQGDVLAYFAGGKIIERFTLKGGQLTVERFDPRTDYPSRPSNRGTGTKPG